MKNKLQRLLICIIVTITTLNLLVTLVPSSSTIVNAEEATVVNEVEIQDDDNWNSKHFVSVDGFVGLISTVFQFPFLLIGKGLHLILTEIAKLGGSEINGFLTPDDIFFNRVGITDIDFFNFAGEESVVQTIRKNIATWYYILRVLSMAILLAVLIYIGIRMAISTVASEKAQYKRMLYDWLVSFALLFLLNYIIMFTIQVNNAFISMLSGPARVTIGEGVVNQLSDMVIFGGGTKSWSAFIVYWMILGMSLGFLLIYIRRMLTIGFLIIISPLITITYSIDRVGDGKSQALNAWIKEFMVNVLIQPFHCIIYLVFVSTVLNTLGTKASIAKMVLAIICMKFVGTAEKIVKEIFGLNDKSGMGEAIQAWATVKALGNVATKIGGKAGSAIAKTRFGQNIVNSQQGQTVRSAINNFKSSKAGGMITGFASQVYPITAGVAAASFEAGMNTKAHAGQVGVAAYSAADAIINGPYRGDGSPQNLRLSQEQLSKCAELIAKNNTFHFQNYKTNQADKDIMRSYARSLIGADMNHLEHDITSALSALTAAYPGDYNTTTAAGMQHLKDLQQMALDPNLDFNDPSTNPLGHAWRNEEKQVVTAIHIRNFARDVNGLYSQRQAAGSNNPAQDVDTFINSL